MSLGSGQTRHLANECLVSYQARQLHSMTPDHMDPANTISARKRRHRVCERKRAEIAVCAFLHHRRALCPLPSELPVEDLAAPDLDATAFFEEAAEIGRASCRERV